MIIVTGGAGFIGSNIVRALNERGIEKILVVDNLGKNDKFKNLVGLKFADYIHREDFLGELEKISGVEAIFHEGACSDTMNYDVNYMMKTNYEYSKALLKFSTANGINFIYASSASTYGSGRNGFRENEFCESALNPYAFSKLLFDRYVRKNLSGVQSKVIGLRYFNVFGPQEQHKGKMASIFYQIYKRLKAGEVTVRLFRGSGGYADGEQRRDFIYVKDVARVNLWFLENPAANGIYNCGTGKATTFNTVAQELIKTLGTGEIEYCDFPDELVGRYQSFTQADTKKLIEAGYNGGFTPISNAVQDYCKFLDAGGYFD